MGESNLIMLYIINKKSNIGEEKKHFRVFKLGQPTQLLVTLWKSNFIHI